MKKYKKTRVEERLLTITSRVKERSAFSDHLTAGMLFLQEKWKNIVPAFVEKN